SAAEKQADLKKAIETEPGTKQVWDYALVLEGLSRGAGVHAAGVVISDRDLSEYIPLTRSKENEVVSQYDMGPLGDLGLLKMDFLGLKTLTVIDDTVKLIWQRVPEFSIKDIPLDDAKAFELFNRGETIGLFQMESGGMTSTAKQFDVQKLDDIIALIALYRPGPMDLIGDYIKRKKGLTKIKYEHPLLEQVCADTYGVMIYQEQVMAAASKLAGYSLGGADLLRRAMGKKDREKMAKERANFIKGCAETNGIAEKKANAIFDLLEKFAGYGFNKSHSAAYGLISYQTAYLKANYPVEFMSGLLSNEVNNTEKIAVFVGECKRMSIPILPPDVNRSALKFTPENQSAIRYGLAAIKNVGEGAMEAAIAERERGGDFDSLEDFCRRLDSKVANRKMLESLVKCGAFDFIGRDRADLFACIEESLAAASASHRDRASGQVSLFDDIPAPVAKTGSRAVTPWTKHETLAAEKELLGFYVTGHPLDAYASVIAAGKFQPISSLAESADKETFRVAGALAQVEKKFTKRDAKPFAVVWVEDLTGVLEIVVWNDVYAKVSELLVPGKVVAVQGTVDKRDEAIRATAQKLKGLTPAAESVNAAPVNGNGGPFVLRFPESTTPAELQSVRQILSMSPGATSVQLLFERRNGEVLRVDAGTDCCVQATPELKQRLGRWLAA
ncbi:MAG: DNA polymerase III subunit alpha, partial [Verrucomicrobiota bacterium]|nr:DNA polymerase III subunit alpha [Verrucomicrobiota bacterium]